VKITKDVTTNFPPHYFDPKLALEYNAEHGLTRKLSGKRFSFSSDLHFLDWVTLLKSIDCWREMLLDRYFLDKLLIFVLCLCKIKAQMWQGMGMPYAQMSPMMPYRRFFEIFPVAIFRPILVRSRVSAVIRFFSMEW
jgi:hypothetical protein